MNALEKHIVKTNKILMEMPGHDRDAHGGLALSQTGYRDGCERCEWLKQDEIKVQKLKREMRSNQ